MNQIDISVIIPCFNEAGNLTDLVQRLDNVFKRRHLRGEVILVDDCSTDETPNVIASLQKTYPCLVAIRHPVNRGQSAGWDTGLELSRGEYACLIDADLQYLPEDVWRLYREITSNPCDMVQGCRSSIGRLRDGRYLLSKGLNSILNFSFRMRLRDNKSGFVIARRDTLHAILRRKHHYYYPNTFIAVAAKAQGFTIREVEVLFQSRLVGKSFIPQFPLSIVYKVSLDVLKGLFEFRLQKQSDPYVAEFVNHYAPQAPSSQRSLDWRRRLMFETYFLTFPFHKWMLTRATRRHYKQLSQSQWLGAEHIRELQESKLRRLILHAYHHVGYYRELLDEAGIRPEDIRSLDDLRRMPMLSKRDARENLHFEILSNNHNKRKVQKITTSGSTGEPFICYVDRHQLEIRWASTLRSQEWTGYRFGDRQMRLWHQTVGMTWSQIFRERLDAILSRRKFIPAFELTEQRLGQFFDSIRRFKPKLIDGYAEALNYLAQFLATHDAAGVNPGAIMSSAQTLPEQSREIIEEVFGCRVFDKYGSREFSGIAYECDQHDGHHVVAESYIVEILREDGEPAQPGEIGEVVVTDLNNFVMPFIRYRIGDLAVAMDNSRCCKCGRGLPRIGAIQGRTQAIIVGANGIRMPGTFFAHVLKDYDHVIRYYQVVQERKEAITLKVVKGPLFTEEAFAECKSVLAHYLGTDMIIDVEYVDEIPLGRTGKRQVVISKLGLDFFSQEEAEPVQQLEDYRKAA